MNKRIRELIDECTEWITGTIDGDVECFDKEKFAELIVRECAGLLDGEWEKEILSGSDAAGILKQHFGVE